MKKRKLAAWKEKGSDTFFPGNRRSYRKRSQLALLS